MLLGIAAIFSTIVFVVNITLTFTIIFLERKNPQSTYAWLLFLWMVPILGFLFYILFSQNLTKRKIFRYNTPENIQYHQLLRQQQRSLSRIIAIDPDSPIEKYRHSIEFHLNVSESLYTNNNEVQIFTDGYKKFDALFHAMEEAQSSIHVEYYIIKNDTLTAKLFDILTRKALEGVEVRLLFDAMGGRYLPRTVLKPSNLPGGKIGIFSHPGLKCSISGQLPKSSQDRDHRRCHRFCRWV